MSDKKLNNLSIDAKLLSACCWELNQKFQNNNRWLGNRVPNCIKQARQLLAKRGESIPLERLIAEYAIAKVARETKHCRCSDCGKEMDWAYFWADTKPFCSTECLLKNTNVCEECGEEVEVTKRFLGNGRLFCCEEHWFSWEHYESLRYTR